MLSDFKTNKLGTEAENIWDLLLIAEVRTF